MLDQLLQGAVIVTGSRKWTARNVVAHVLDYYDPQLVVHGGALGADTFAHAWCKSHGRVGMVCFPDWAVRRAALVRNVFMLDLFESATVVAFPMPDSRGTWHTVREALKRNMPVFVFAPDGSPIAVDQWPVWVTKG